MGVTCNDPVRLDDLDRKILDHLERDGRATLADVGAAVGLSASAVKRRVDRLHETGVIVGYTAVIDPQALGDRLEAFVELYCADSVAPGDLLASVAGLPAVIAAHTVAGDADAVVRVRVEGIEELERVIEELRRDPRSCGRARWSRCLRWSSDRDADCRALTRLAFEELGARHRRDRAGPPGDRRPRVRPRPAEGAARRHRGRGLRDACAGGAALAGRAAAVACPSAVR